MAISYLDSGRTNQKRRTRRAVLEAAAALIRDGRTPTVAEAAEAADVSRATAYRYFATQDALLVEVATVGPSISAAELLGPAAGSDDAGERARVLVERLTKFMLDNDRSLRTMLKLSLERDTEGAGDVPLREGRRATYLEEALAPLRARLSPGELRRVNAALGMVIGTEALVVLRDIYELSPDEALRLMRWAAAALLRVATEDGPPT